MKYTKIQKEIIFELIYDEYKEQISLLKEEFYIKRAKYECSFFRKFINMWVTPFELQSFDNYLSENYIFIWSIKNYL